MEKTRHQFTHRIATTDDVPQIGQLMALAIEHNMAAFLNPEQVQAAAESMGVDRLLISDGTYFVIETCQHGETVLVGCGGWGRRKTLYGGDQTAGRDDNLSDPAVDAARIRAMYTHPDWVRCGIGSLLLQLGETAARDAGFRRIELGSTVPGEPLYRARGYEEVSREHLVAANGAESIVIKMSKFL